MIGASPLDIKIYMGADFVLPFQLLDANNVAVSLSGAGIAAMIRNDIEDAAPIISMTGTIVDGPNGIGQASLTGAQTATIAVDNSPAKKRAITTYVWDLNVTFADGTIVRVYEGVAYISPEATR